MLVCISESASVWGSTLPLSVSETDVKATHALKSTGKGDQEAFNLKATCSEPGKGSFFSFSFCFLFPTGHHWSQLSAVIYGGINK